MAQTLPCHILGLDNSPKAIEMARESLTGGLEKRVELLCYDFSYVSDKYDVIFVSNLYHLLKPEERAKLRETVKRCLKADGILFLSAFSTRDPQHFGQGAPVEGEGNTFLDERYYHFNTREDLETEFDFIHISALFEREFHEIRTNGNHHHIAWIMMGSLRAIIRRMSSIKVLSRSIKRVLRSPMTKRGFSMTALWKGIFVLTPTMMYS